LAAAKVVLVNLTLLVKMAFTTITSALFGLLRKLLRLLRRILLLLIPRQSSSSLKI